MNQDLALSLLGEVMEWDLERSRTEFAWLQLMSRFKYDGYSDFVAGVRFIERCCRCTSPLTSHRSPPNIAPLSSRAHS
jgi:hypothetical protein